MLMAWTLLAAAAMLGLAMLLNVYRLLRGPDTADRILALDTLYVNATGLIVLLGLHTGSTLYFEAALLIAALGFISTVALSKYLLRGDIIE
ncbi:MAG: K+/H+ antiporter subunit F [Betaproteobacteria bacterium]|jgi:multicomponent K+:H+ antiporter subunit F|nr:K+/H+ antiporter subunit F [Rhodocyclaceae bacterium]MCA3133495.1 K+/H+ antiporter subunit F [Rhodocyclaceae bacterium]MCA3141429.1 K+/H+ antiporter subunit F [Rhodocyclaceae bacterium]MCA3145760.1 K+/H+ antiporter subunit F [Rhodocyclaceae bacterium]MCE2897970.1 K+/H+ antiporter subunit F [Betaproteobacteria bacterium]